MIIFKSASSMSAYLGEQSARNRQIGFVPTMGALHEGHLSLVAQSKDENDITVCSIFVNPTQFTNAVDIERYPVTLERDIELLTGALCTVLFLPSAPEVYGHGYVAPHYDLGGIETVLEGAHRPGHFQGVCQVVDRLLSIVPCKMLYLGQKDYQQCMVIRRLIEITGRAETVSLRIVPTVREKTGLAMSSRNMRLSEEQLGKARSISQALYRVRDAKSGQDVRSLERNVTQQLSEEGFIVDYVSIADAHTLEPAASTAGAVVCLIAASIGGVRLIDNLPLN